MLGGGAAKDKDQLPAKKVEIHQLNIKTLNAA